MTTKQLIRKLEHPPCNQIAAVRIEFADGSVYEVTPDTAVERRLERTKAKKRAK